MAADDLQGVGPILRQMYNITGLLQGGFTEICQFQFIVNNKQFSLRPAGRPD